MQAIEIVGSRRTRISIEAPSQEVVFTVWDTVLPSNEVAVRAYTETQLAPFLIITSALFGAIKIVLQDYELTEEEAGIWKGVAHYGRRLPRQTGDVILSFDGTGGQAHITTSKETVNSYGRGPPGPPVLEPGAPVAGGSLTADTNYQWVVTAVSIGGESGPSNEVSVLTTDVLKRVSLTWSEVPKATSYRVYRAEFGTYVTPCLVGETTITTLIDNGDALLDGAPPEDAEGTQIEIPSFSRAIGVNNQTVEGTDIVIPVAKFTYQYYPHVDLMTATYIRTLMRMGGKVNDADWKSWEAGEVLCLGVSGQPRGSDDWELGMHFIASENVQGLTVGDIEDIIKAGHDYLWVRFCDSVDVSKMIKEPEFAFVERLYDPVDFAQLGIGV